jgi:quercetin dioxygenase-like cupin family protein
MHGVGTLVDATEALGPYEGHSSGLTRLRTVDDAMGSIHMAVAVCTLEPGGSVEFHAHAFEEGLYVLEGRLDVDAGTPAVVEADGYAWIGVGNPHELRNGGDDPVRWLEMSAPQPGTGEFQDTAFVDPSFAPDDRAFATGRFESGQLPPPSGEILEGFAAANVARASLKMLIDPAFGASQFNLFVVEYAPGGSINPHDHAFEEAYLYVSGEIEARLDDRSYTLGAGDFCWTGVGSIHSFANRGDEPVRWIETQAPQPPSRHQARFLADWERLVGGDR